MATPLLSVIIPTHNRPQILRQTLEHLERQTIASEIEVIVVNDGSELRIMNKELRITVINVPPCHQGKARNRGVMEASAPLTMFIGDDIFLAPDACEQHWKRRHEKRAVLGFTTWDPAVGITPTMTWLEKSGWQFGYPMIERHAGSVVPTSRQHSFTYTSHISLPTKIAKKYPFREDVELYGWEDIEWGYRLREAGIHLFYEPEAKALHHHHMTLEQSLKRMEILGRSAVVIQRASSRLQLVPKGLKLQKYRIAAKLPGMRGKHAKAFLRGLSIN